VHVQRREHCVVEFVLRRRQPVAEHPLIMVVDERDRPDDRRFVRSRRLVDERVADHVAERLGPAA
jgi:hypothetical protein